MSTAHCLLIYNIKCINSVLYLCYAPGLTCSEQNFVTKAGAQRYAAEHGVALVAPDTSPSKSQDMPLERSINTPLGSRWLECCIVTANCYFVSQKY